MPVFTNSNMNNLFFGNSIFFVLTATSNFLSADMKLLISFTTHLASLRGQPKYSQLILTFSVTEGLIFPMAFLKCSAVTNNGCFVSPNSMYSFKAITPVSRTRAAKSAPV